jgi:hypothetical protein
MPEELDREVFLCWRDGVFLLSILAYLINKFVFKPIYVGGFYHADVNDLLCISFNLPQMLWLLRRIGFCNRINRSEKPPQSDRVFVRD